MSSSSESIRKVLSKFANNGLRTELEKLQANPLNGFTLIRVSDNPQRCYFEVRVAQGTLYTNETYQLEVEFPYGYPMDAPQVIFTDPVPVHPQVYDNGHICLAVLYDKWRAVMRLSSICESILSMLSSASVKEKPKDNEKCKHGHSNCLTKKRKRTI